MLFTIFKYLFLFQRYSSFYPPSFTRYICYRTHSFKWRDSRLFRNDTTSYRLRNSETRTDYLGKSFSYSGAALWESLPTDIRVSKTLGEFKAKLSNFSFELTNNTASLKSSTFVFIYSIYQAIGHFRITFSLFLKASLGAHPLI